MMRFIITLMFLDLTTVGAFASVVVVPDDQGTIQAAIDQSVDGDTVLVRPGIYLENIDFLGKAITVRSEKGATVTVIDGNQSGSVVRFQNGEGSSSVLEGFTLTNGNGTRLPPTQFRFGGGICCTGSSSPVIRDNVVSGNNAGHGGGIYAESSSPLVSHNTISQNTTTGEGAGVMCYQTDGLTIEHNLVEGNQAATWGGGVELALVTSITIFGNVIRKNEAVHDGSGGILIARNCTGAIVNNLVYENTANRFGGGIDVFYKSHVTLSNNTVCANSAEKGGGISCREQSTITVSNTILWGNRAKLGPEIFFNAPHLPSSGSIDFSDLRGGWASVHLEPNCTLTWGRKMIDASPDFVDRANGDYHLTYTSPCRDAGNNTATMATRDFEDDPRFAWGGAVDLGADEFYTHLYVTDGEVPGDSVEVKLVGPPGTAPVVLGIGSDVLTSPIVTPWGDFLLAPPWFPVPLEPIPATGVLVFEAPNPPWRPAANVFPLQALIGWSEDSLTNVAWLKVR